MKEGEIIRAAVTEVHDYGGVSIEAEGKSGFVQPVELSWTPETQKPNEVPRVGDTIEVYVYAITPARFFASIRQARPELNPWREPTKYSIGSIHVGTVRRVLAWGCEIQLDAGVNGMILLDKYPGHYPGGGTIGVEIIGVDPVLRKIELKPKP